MTYKVFFFKHGFSSHNFVSNCCRDVGKTALGEKFCSCEDIVIVCFFLLLLTVKQPLNFYTLASTICYFLHIQLLVLLLMLMQLHFGQLLRFIVSGTCNYEDVSALCLWHTL